MNRRCMEEWYFKPLTVATHWENWDAEGHYFTEYPFLYLNYLHRLTVMDILYNLKNPLKNLRSDYFNKNNWEPGVWRRDFSGHAMKCTHPCSRKSGIVVSMFCDFMTSSIFSLIFFFFPFFSLKVSFVCRSSSKLHQGTIFDLKSVNYLLTRRMQNPY